jgi:putative tricarboxylic transport membrane protein
VILGVILGPLMETQARRALVASGNDLGVFVSRPLTVVLLLIAIGALVTPFILRRRGAPPISAED